MSLNVVVEPELPELVELEPPVVELEPPAAPVGMEAGALPLMELELTPEEEELAADEEDVAVWRRSKGEAEADEAAARARTNDGESFMMNKLDEDGWCA